MRAELFYQSDVNQAIPLILVTKQQWDSGLLEDREGDRDFLSSQRFTGQIGDVVLVVNEKGEPLCAYSGVGENNLALAMANAALRLPPGAYCLEQALPLFAEASWALAQYRFDHYKKQEISPRILSLNAEHLPTVCAEAATIFLVRDLINSPPNVMTPEALSKTMANMAAHFGAGFEEWVGDELLDTNFPAIHMVGRASVNAPRLLCLTWGDASHPKVALVGKGVCFDSGGLDIKPSSGMRLMKKDMGGAAHALGLAQWIMTNKLPVYLQVLVPAVENSIGPDAFRPGDIVVMRNGLSVEIDNTDAEGRLILADALVKASENQPDLVIDFATLTGAARVAVGTEIAAMFSNDDALSAELELASKAVNDPLWRLPLFSGYESLIDSSVADMANASASPYAGAITAALFLKRFIPKETSWVHFDIMAWNVASKPGKPEGGEAMAIRALAYYLEKKYG